MHFDNSSIFHLLCVMLSFLAGITRLSHEIRIQLIHFKQKIHSGTRQDQAQRTTKKASVTSKTKAFKIMFQ
jgi:hypothetical protein